jgi:antitoxin (DNA-binding transcriptional repressor) of toxin-antitoxin stability system
MQELTVAEIRKNFSAILKEVEAGSEIGVLYGRNRKPVAKIVPYQADGQIKLGMLEGKGNIKFVGDGKISIEEFIGQ